MAFLHFRLADEAWLSACEQCQQVVAFSAAEAELESADQNHDCGDKQPDRSKPLSEDRKSQHIA